MILMGGGGTRPVERVFHGENADEKMPLTHVSSATQPPPMAL